MKKDSKCKIVVTGMGVVSALGIGQSETWENLCNGRFNISKIKDSFYDNLPDNFKLFSVKGFNVKDFKLNEGIYNEMLSWKQGSKSIDLDYFFAAIKLAISDSFLDANRLHGAGLFLTHENPGIEKFCSDVIGETYIMSKNIYNLSGEGYSRKLYKKFTREVNDLQTFMFLYFIAKMFGIHGYSLFVNNSCASGLYALEAASQSIRQKQCKCAVVASSEYPAVYKYLWFDQLGLLSNSGKIQPFSKERDGFICGEGSTALILEDFEHAKQRGANIYGEYVGGGFVLDSWKITMPDILSRYYEMAMNLAIERCCIRKEAIDIICAHGLGSRILDSYEGNSFTRIFANKYNMPAVVSFKPYIGHTLGNCALLEVALLLLCMKNDIVVSAVNCGELDPKIKINLVTKKMHKKLKIAMKTVWGFGGYNAATIFRKI